MTTIDELEARGAEIDRADRAACGVLAEVMRELAVQLPDGSRLALDLAGTAKYLAHIGGDVGWTAPGLWGGTTAKLFARGLYNERVGNGGA
ncbi:MAG: hypothetical protein WEB79_08460 [Thermoleophilaceae bacterium]